MITVLKVYTPRQLQVVTQKLCIFSQAGLIFIYLQIKQDWQQTK